MIQMSNKCEYCDGRYHVGTVYTDTCNIAHVVLVCDYHSLGLRGRGCRVERDIEKKHGVKIANRVAEWHVEQDVMDVLEQKRKRRKARG